MIDRLRAWWGLRTVRHVAIDGLALTLPPGVLDPVLFALFGWSYLCGAALTWLRV